MRRLHLFEFGDQAWLPRILRDAETAYLAVAYRFFPLAKRWAEIISTVLPRQAAAQIVDLCSGSGGPMPLIVEELKKLGYEATAKLTDLYPNPKSALRPQISWEAKPVDATHVSPEINGVRTMFSAFHHFPPVAGKAILQDAFDRRCAICIFESAPGTLLGAFTALLIPVNVLALMPFARPFRWTYLLFTYLIPLLPVIVFWDGLISMLRIYSSEEMKKLTADMHAPDYAWEISRIKMRGVPGGLPYLVGRPIS